MSIQEGPQPRYNVSPSALALILAVAILGLVLGNISSRVSNVERRVATNEAKITRIEDWIVSSGELASQRHSDIMKALGSMVTNQEKAVTTLDYMAQYYRRAEAELETKRK